MAVVTQKALILMGSKPIQQTRNNLTVNRSFSKPLNITTHKKQIHAKQHAKIRKTKITAYPIRHIPCVDISRNKTYYAVLPKTVLLVKSKQLLLTTLSLNTTILV